MVSSLEGDGGGDIGIVEVDNVFSLLTAADSTSEEGEEIVSAQRVASTN
jgi:hypothetical protein